MFEKHEICLDVMLSIMNVMVNIKKRFEQFLTYIPYNPNLVWRSSIELLQLHLHFASKRKMIWNLVSSLFVWEIGNVDWLIWKFNIIRISLIFITICSYLKISNHLNLVRIITSWKMENFRRRSKSSKLSKLKTSMVLSDHIWIGWNRLSQCTISLHCFIGKLNI